MSPETFTLLTQATLETIYMVIFSGFFAVVFGLPLGIALTATKPKGLFAAAIWHRILAFLVDVTRSVPFIILLIAIIPLTRVLAGTSIGTTAAIVPLSFAAIPFFARIVESALNGIPHGLIEAGRTMGANSSQIMLHILLREAKPNLIKGITLTLINLVAYSAMAGVVGGGGLGDLAIRYGYQRFEIETMLLTVTILVVLVQLLQRSGDYLVQKVEHRKHPS